MLWSSQAFVDPTTFSSHPVEDSLGSTGRVLVVCTTSSLQQSLGSLWDTKRSQPKGFSTIYNRGKRLYLLSCKIG